MKLNKTNFGQHLKETRIAKNLTVAELAHKSRVNILTITVIEEGQHLPTLEDFAGLCEGLGTTPTQLLAWSKVGGTSIFDRLYQEKFNARVMQEEAKNEEKKNV